MEYRFMNESPIWGGGLKFVETIYQKYAKRKGGKGIGDMCLSLETSRIGGLRRKASLRIGGEQSD